MPASSLVKYLDRTTDGRGNRLSWFRSDIDGLPFRYGANEQPPEFLTGEEAEERLVESADAQIREFNLWEPQDAADYADLLGRICNGIARLLVDRRFTELKGTRPDPDCPGGTIQYVRRAVYVEWADLAMIDGRPMPSQRPFIGRSNEDQ